MPHPTRTIAQSIASLLRHDGQRWVTPDGTLTMDDFICFNSARVEHRPGRASSDEWRAIFPDGSAITACGGAWDLGFPECWCWQGNGHENCTAGEA